MTFIEFNFASVVAVGHVICLFGIIKIYKYEVTDFYIDLIVDDLVFILIVAAPLLYVVGASEDSSAVIRGLICALTIMALLYLFADALVFRAFNVELTTMLMIRHIGDLRNGFRKEAARLFRLGHRDFRFYLPVIVLAGTAPSIMAFSDADSTFLGLFFLSLAYVALIKTSPIRCPRKYYVVAWVIAAYHLGVAFEWNSYVDRFVVELPALLLFAPLVWRLFFVRSLYLKKAITPPCYVWGLFMAETWEKSPGFKIREEDVAMSELKGIPFQPSNQFGKLMNANVLLITLESVGRDHVRAYGGEASMPTLEHFSSEAVIGSNHFCICPNTTGALEALCLGRYPIEKAKIGYLTELADTGYNSFFLTIDDTSLYGLADTLDRAGYRHIIDRPLFSNPKSDYALFTEGVDLFINRRADQDERFFLHIHTTDTHMDYDVHDKIRFSQWSHLGDRGRYLNCIEEADSILGHIIERMTDASLMDDTLLIITSDHGQSFGEFGYDGHANSIGKEQINVPLLIHHPRLDKCVIEFSSHFDLMPTVLDLLGVNSAIQGLGSSVFLEGRPTKLLLHSDSLRWGYPSNTGLILGPVKFSKDLVYNRSTVLDWNDLESSVISVTECEYLSELIRVMLEKLGYPVKTMIPRMTPRMQQNSELNLE